MADKPSCVISLIRGSTALLSPECLEPCVFSFTLSIRKREGWKGEGKTNFISVFTGYQNAQLQKLYWRRQNWACNANLVENIKWEGEKKSKRMSNRGQVELSHLPSGWLQAAQVPSGSLLYTSVKGLVSLSTVWPRFPLNTMLLVPHSIIRNCSNSSKYGLIRGSSHLLPTTRDMFTAYLCWFIHSVFTFKPGLWDTGAWNERLRDIEKYISVRHLLTHRTVQG